MADRREGTNGEPHLAQARVFAALARSLRAWPAHFIEQCLIRESVVVNTSPHRTHWRECARQATTG
ncbi:MAG: hypothetical protein ACHQAY_05355 [Hyphomicrobiales bacterium]